MAPLNGTAKHAPKPQIEAALSVTPTEETTPRLSRRVSVAGSAAGSAVFWNRFHIVLYYEAAASEDSGTSLAGWTKESLAKALQEQPLLAGRLRRRQEGEGDDQLEIVANDSGVRLFEARIAQTLPEFFDRWKEIGEKAEAELAFWKDVDEANPRFSPLFYIQVTNFECGGYSVGISCSFLISDPMGIISLLRTWANIHTNMVSQPDMTKLPLYYLPNFKPYPSSLSNQFGSSQMKYRGKSLFFKAAAAAGKLNSPNDEARKSLALLCIEEVELKLGAKTASEFSLILKESAGEIKAERWGRDLVRRSPTEFRSGLGCAGWDDLAQANEVSFYGGNKPVRVSFWVSCVPGEGLVVMSPCNDEKHDVGVIVTVPN